MYLTMPRTRGFLSGGLGQAKPPPFFTRYQEQPIGPELPPLPPLVPWWQRKPPTKAKLPPAPPPLTWWKELGAKGERGVTAAEMAARVEAERLRTEGPDWMQNQQDPKTGEIFLRGWQPIDEPENYPNVTAIRVLPGGAMQLRMQSGEERFDLSNFRSTPEMPRFDFKAAKDALKGEEERIKHEKEAARVLRLPPPIPAPRPWKPPTPSPLLPAETYDFRVALPTPAGTQAYAAQEAADAAFEAKYAAVRAKFAAPVLPPARPVTGRAAWEKAQPTPKVSAVPTGYRLCLSGITYAVFRKGATMLNAWSAAFGFHSRLAPKKKIVTTMTAAARQAEMRRRAAAGEPAAPVTIFAPPTTYVPA